MRASRALSVRWAADASHAAQLLPMSVVERLCGEPRSEDMYLLRLVVALERDDHVGFAAYRPTAGSIRLAHEFWVDPVARCGLPSVTESLLMALEDTARADGCSRVVVVINQSSTLRSAIEDSGYHLSLAGGGRRWFEKSLADDRRPLDSA